MFASIEGKWWSGLQILQKVSKPGQVYAIDCDVQSVGIPYSDAFCVKSHYCLVRLSDRRCRLRVYGCVRYKKSVWGLVKGEHFRLALI